MNCRDVQNNLWFYLENPNTEENRAFRQHIDTCPECKTIANQLAMTKQMLEMDIPKPSDQFEQNVWRKIRAQEQKMTKKTPNTWFYISNFSTVAAAVVGLVLGVWLGSFYPTQTAQNSGQSVQEKYYLDDFNQEFIEYAFLAENEE